MKHKHANILQAIIEDSDVKLEYRYNADKPWIFSNLYDFFYYLSLAGSGEFRIALKTIRIGDVYVPEPMRVAPAAGTQYWVINLCWTEMSGPMVWRNDTTDNRLLKLGLCHLTKDACGTHAEAIIKNHGGVP